MRFTPKFDNNEEAIVHSTDSPELDGMHVVVKGIAIEQYPQQILYIIENFDLDRFDNGYDCIIMTSSCLKKVE